MNTKSIIAGLQLLQNYYTDEDGYNNGAEHDQFYAYPTEKPLTDDDLGKMIDLGWHQEHEECDCGAEFSKSDYRQDESWTCYL